MSVKLNLYHYCRYYYELKSGYAFRFNCSLFVGDPVDELFGIGYRLLFGGDRDDPVVVIGSETNPHRHPRLRIPNSYGPDY